MNLLELCQELADRQISVLFSGELMHIDAPHRAVTPPVLDEIGNWLWALRMQAEHGADHPDLIEKIHSVLTCRESEAWLWMSIDERRACRFGLACYFDGLGTKDQFPPAHQKFLDQ